MTPDVLSIVSWGQYLHWAELQFVRYKACDELTNTGEIVGTVAHWLAAEYVVLDGWREVGGSDVAIDRILELYPDHCDILRRCRNAVYHFQREILERIVRCITNEHEELSVAGALHFEFQKYLLQYPYRFSGRAGEVVALRTEIAECIGWFPDDSLIARAWRVHNGCFELIARTGEESSELAQEVRAAAASTAERIRQLDLTPMTSNLARVRHAAAPKGTDIDRSRRP